MSLEFKSPPELTFTPQGLEREQELARLRQLVATKDGIIAALRGVIGHQGEILRLYHTLIGNGEDEANA